MDITIEESPVIQKTKELCQTILAQPNMRSIRQRIDAFMSDNQARSQYESLVNKGETLQHKQQMSMPLTSEEVADFEKDRDTLMKNAIARDFLDAQEELHEVRQSVQQYLSKTLELGRLPTEEEMNGCCGGGHGHGGCGCSH